jgi:hypothetical protein
MSNTRFRTSGLVPMRSLASDVRLNTSSVCLYAASTAHLPRMDSKCGTPPHYFKKPLFVALFVIRTALPGQAGPASMEIVEDFASLFRLTDVHQRVRRLMTLESLSRLYLFWTIPSNVSKSSEVDDTVLSERSFIVNLHTLNLRTLVLATMAMSVAAFAQLPISSADGPFQIRYAANTTVGDSYIDVSNDGASMTTTTIASGQNTLAVSGSICVNAYAFNADEEILSCCSCPLTPNGLVALSVQKDLLNNTLTGRASPSSIVIKLVATVPQAGVATTGNPCGTSASTVNPLNLAIGMVAWGTSLHANTSSTTTTYALTETPFTVAAPSPAELARLASVCSIAQLQGSGYGICNSCELAGLGASASNQ